MQNGEYKLAVQRGQQAYYAKIRLQAELDDTQPQLVVEFALDSSLPAYWANWQIGVQFGCAYVWEGLSRGRTGMRVQVLELHGYPVDSTHS